ncbi:MAG TPA: 2-oxoacid:ferredoxin oxidoreductase subunit gamma [Clostridiales bacterium]|jgi:2-oxoglutarate ferredoxin oxidoreductase subunit gamma|nr:2-oxoacid:ferredoxin oxidoreductase subunit gamma [Clostridiales bacterium]
MSNKYEIRLSGSGGQGLILAGIILADAGLKSGKNSIQSQSYGPEARGGASKAEVIISDGEINYPKVEQCDILLSLTQKSYDEYIDSLKKDGILVVDEKIEIDETLEAKIYRLPIISTANEKLKKPMVANIVSLGSICGISKIIDEKSLEEAILNRIPPGTEEINKKAFQEGLKLV